MANTIRSIVPALRALAFSIGLTAGAAAWMPATAAVPIEAFFTNPEFSEARLSPSGNYVAAKASHNGQRMRLIVVDLQNNAAKVVAQFARADIRDFQWISDQRLLFNLTDRSVGQGDVAHAPGLFAVDRDGGNFRQLVNRTGHVLSTPAAARMLPWYHFMLDQSGSMDSESVYVIRRNFQNENADELVFGELLHLNTLTGQTKYVPRPPDSVGWLLDTRGEPRLAVGMEKNQKKIYVRAQGQQEWRQIASFAAVGKSEGGFTPLALTADDKLYVSSTAAGDKAAVHTLDLATGKLSKDPLVLLDGYDFDGHLLFRNDTLIGLRFTSDALGTQWLDPAMKALQEEVDALLPATVNLLSPPQQADAPNLLVQSYSDRQPILTYIYHRASKKLNQVGANRSLIQPQQMAQQQFLRYKARDGLPIPALLTVPAHAKGQKLPLVVLVHGGPYVRGNSWGWHPDSQFLASRGYAVLEPEFRGSRGFGTRHFFAGFKQWGLKMQDDIADGARWAIDQGLADPQRICIAGASYGGYATLMGLINDPELYKCGVNWVGVTDIKLMYTDTWASRSDVTLFAKRYGMPEMIGDLEKDAEQLKATSPLLQAHRLKQPLLMAYGGSDMRVPQFHGNKFRDAVSATNQDVEWIVYPEEGHGWVLPHNRIDFWRRVEQFLDRNIGPASQHKKQPAAAMPPKESPP
ncbi:alpha/beta hydrolase family protein [Pseudoduganella violacea]|uniref:Dipeptidyl aminopeptidase/acylaminoacyl peptidase n=1 Tax=Pseudoduganella violacea TaxID=1715466 RepID=A0A7W5FV12_9BURK|nr:alpha/beta fold hydrolase [Pseudoduganella violacea]MBB3119738.1 dipeptidyl aminopeptidase/acylaminoacyl peptidase [Pseudoduganella violacea]